MISRAAVLHRPGTPLRVQEVDVQAPKRGEVQVRIHAAGVCHSDLHVMKGDLPITTPIVMGHEGSGVIESVGEDVSDLEPGDHVILLWRISCGQCVHCSRGRPALCEIGSRVRSTGLMPDGESRFHDLDGREIRHFCGVSTFSELSTVPKAAVLKIRRDFPLEKAALLGCGVITGVGAVVNAAKVTVGSSVAVFGCGGIGLNVIQGARIAGALTIIAVDVHARKLSEAKVFGASHVIDSGKENPVEAIHRLTKGLGVDFAFEAIGLPGTIQQSFEAVSKSGTCTVLGISPATAAISINPNDLVYSEKKLQGSLYGSAIPRIDLGNLIEMHLDGRLLLDELLTKTFPLDRINDAYAALERGDLARGLILPGT